MPNELCARDKVERGASADRAEGVTVHPSSAALVKLPEVILSVRPVVVVWSKHQNPLRYVLKPRIAWLHPQGF